jgi:hypothetical protein
LFQHAPFILPDCAEDARKSAAQKYRQPGAVLLRVAGSAVASVGGRRSATHCAAALVG